MGKPDDHDKENSQKKREKFLVDTDAGVDDATAILYLLGAEKLNGNIRVVGITCADGNAEVDDVLINVLKTLKTVDRLDIPVYKGSASALLYKEPKEYYFGKDGFGDFDFPNPPDLSLVKEKHAVNALIHYVKKRPGEISLLCLAPLTNIAMAIRLYPDFLKDVKDVFILGGAVEGKGAMKPGIEFNFFMDPEAAYIVLQNAQETGKKITLIPSETFLDRCNLPMQWRKNVLGSLKSPAMELLNKAENKSLKGDLWFQADSLLAATALNTSLIMSKIVHPVKVETCGTISRGSVFVDYYNNTPLATVNIVKELDMETYKDLLLKYLNV